MSIVTNELIQKAKVQHGEVFVLEATTEADTTLGDVSENPAIDQEIEKAEGEFVAEAGKVYAILKRPDRRIIGLAMSYKDPLQMGNSILKNTIVIIDKADCADPEILENQTANMAASTEVLRLIEIGTAKLKKY